MNTGHEGVGMAHCRADTSYLSALDKSEIMVPILACVPNDKMRTKCACASYSSLIKIDSFTVEKLVCPKPCFGLVLLSITSSLTSVDLIQYGQLVFFSNTP